MIHSMSGGVLDGGEFYRFVKVRLAEGTAWYLSPFAAAAGDRVLVPVQGGTAEGEVLRVELCTAQNAPFPPSRTAEILTKLLTRDGKGDTIDKP